MGDTESVIIGYWRARGFVHPIILILEYLEVKYELRHHDCGPAPHYDIKTWLATKCDILEGFDFPNLPYYQDGSFKITNFMAIVQYLARKHKLMPDGKDEKALVDLDVLREEAVDVVWATINYVYFYNHRHMGTSPSEAEKLEKRIAYRETLTRRLIPITKKFKNTNGKFFLGDFITFVDFLMFDFLDHVRLLESDAFFEQNCPELLKFLKEFENLPTLKQYFQSNRFKRFPIFPERSFIGRVENDWPNLPTSSTK